MSTQDFFARNPVFTHAQFAASRPSGDAAGGRSVDALLAYHVRKGHLLRIRRGLYAVVPAGFSPHNALVDGYIVASKLAEDALIGYHTALQLHGFAYSLSERFLYITQHATRTLTFRSLEFRPVLVPRRLRDAGGADIGVTRVDRAGIDVRATTLERTMVDVLDRLDLGGGWEEVWRSLEAVGLFDIPEVIEYASLLDNSTTIAKVGFFLEQHRSELLVEEAHLEALREKAPRQPHYVEGSRGAPNVLLGGWNIIVPTSVAERSWQDVP
jgi:predicted transcriptional regulator of viral defense system